MARDLAIRLTPAEEAQRDALAKSPAQSPSELALEAVRDVLRFDTAFREAVEQGLAAVAEGDVLPFDDVELGLRDYMAGKSAS